jgi:hypothetical protein
MKEIALRVQLEEMEQLFDTLPETEREKLIAMGIQSLKNYDPKLSTDQHEIARLFDQMKLCIKFTRIKLDSAKLESRRLSKIIEKNNR